MTIRLLPNIRGTYRVNVPLNKTNWFAVGGPAQVLYRPLDLEDLIHFMENKPDDINATILGVGSNVIIRDGGIDGVVIKLSREFSHIKIEDNKLIAGAAVLNFNLAQFCLTNNIKNYEFLVGIPGSIGGGVAMNGGAYNSDFSQNILYIKAIDEKGLLHTIPNEKIGFIYRGNTLPENFITVEAAFKIEYGEESAIREKMDNIIRVRAETQPIKERTSGSTFKNPAQGLKAWELIDQAGLRGKRIGKAQMSEKHANFMINTGGATASDLENLGELVREEVYKKTGIMLEWEVKRIGKFI